MSDTYPGIDDWRRDALDRAPSRSRAGDGAGWYVGLTRTAADLELVLEGVAREIGDLEAAGRYVLDARAALYGGDAAGVSTEELRRLAIGSRAAMASTGTDASLYRMWAALTGSEDVQVRVIGVTARSVFLAARIGFVPSSSWLRAAGRIVDRSVEAGMDWSAVVHVGGVLRWGAAPPGWGIGTWAYPLIRP